MVPAPDPQVEIPATKQTIGFSELVALTNVKSLGFKQARLWSRPAPDPQVEIPATKQTIGFSELVVSKMWKVWAVNRLGYDPGQPRIHR